MSEDLAKRLEKFTNLGIDIQAVMEERLSPSEQEDLIAQISILDEFGGKLRARMKDRDAVAHACLQEIVQWSCDLLHYMGMEFSSANLNVVLSFAGSCVSEDNDRWRGYMKDLAPRSIQTLSEQLAEGYTGTPDG